MSDKPVPGTHLGRLDPEARARRAIKNARRANRVHPKGSHGLDMPVPGRPKTRLMIRGNSGRAR